MPTNESNRCDPAGPNSKERFDRLGSWCGGAWRQHAIARAIYLEHQAIHVRSLEESDVKRELVGQIFCHLRVAQETASRKIFFRGAIERTWLNIHAAELLLLEIADTGRVDGWSSSVLELAKNRLSDSDCRLVKLRELCSSGEREKGDENRSEELRRAMMAALAGSYTSMSGWYSRMRHLRNILSLAVIFTAAMVVGLGFWGFVQPDVLSLCFGPPDKLVCPHDRATKGQGGEEPGEKPLENGDDPQVEPNNVDVLLVISFGFAGATISGIPMLAKLRESATPYGLSIAVLALKLPAGALSAFIGITLIRGEFVPGLTQLDTGAQILAWSAIFGASQLAVTRLVDKKAWEVMSDMTGDSGKNDGLRRTRGGEGGVADGLSVERGSSDG